jgi:hypothetical protein
MEQNYNQPPRRTDTPLVIMPEPIGVPDGVPPPKELDQEIRERMAADQKKRWAIMDKLRTRQKQQQRKANAAHEKQRLERFRRNYEIVAHIIIDSLTDVKKDKEQRDQWRTKLEQRMHVRKIPRITGPNV